MFAPGALASFETTMRVHIHETLPKLAHETMVEAARLTVQRVETEQRSRSGGIIPDHTAIVDGRRNATFDSVRPDGVILLDWNYLTEAVIRTVEYLRLHGPEVKGEWKSAIVVEVDGTIMSPGRRLPKSAKRAMVGIVTPYSRRLEIGNRRDGKPFVLQVPQHFVEKAAMSLRRELRGIAEVKYRWASFLGQNQQVTRKQLRDSRVPALEITEVQAL